MKIIEIKLKGVEITDTWHLLAMIDKMFDLKYPVTVTINEIFETSGAKLKTAIDNRSNKVKLKLRLSYALALFVFLIHLELCNELKNYQNIVYVLIGQIDKQLFQFRNNNFAQMVNSIDSKTAKELTANLPFKF